MMTKCSFLAKLNISALIPHWFIFPSDANPPHRPNRLWAWHVPIKTWNFLALVSLVKRKPFIQLSEKASSRNFLCQIASHIPLYSFSLIPSSSSPSLSMVVFVVYSTKHWFSAEPRSPTWSFKTHTETQELSRVDACPLAQFPDLN